MLRLYLQLGRLVEHRWSSMSAVSRQDAALLMTGACGELCDAHVTCDSRRDGLTWPRLCMTMCFDEAELLRRKWRDYQLSLWQRGAPPGDHPQRRSNLLIARFTLTIPPPA